MDFWARGFLVTLSIMFDEAFAEEDLSHALQKILLCIHLKKLHLDLCYEQFIALSTLPDAALSHLLEFELNIAFLDDNININMNDLHPLISQLQSIRFHFDQPSPGAWIDFLCPCLPWSQLQNLDFGVNVADPHLIFCILQQMPVLEGLALFVSGTSMPEQVTMSSLWDLILKLHMGGVLQHGTDSYIMIT